MDSVFKSLLLLLLLLLLLFIYLFIYILNAINGLSQTYFRYIYLSCPENGSPKDEAHVI